MSEEASELDVSLLRPHADARTLRNSLQRGLVQNRIYHHLRESEKRNGVTLADVPGFAGGMNAHVPVIRSANTSREVGDVQGWDRLASTSIVVLTFGVVSGVEGAHCFVGPDVEGRASCRLDLKVI